MVIFIGLMLFAILYTIEYKLPLKFRFVQNIDKHTAFLCDINLSQYSKCIINYFCTIGDDLRTFINIKTFVIVGI